jgi:hypothetical protein
MSRSSVARNNRRKAKRERRKELSPKRTRQDPGKDLYASIDGAIDAVLARQGDLSSEMIIQALCLVTCNLALQEGIPTSSIQRMMGDYMEQVAGVMRARQEIEQRRVSPGGLILPG